MSPEVILCRGHSTKADIYSLGATLIHMQTGTPPWVKRYPRSAYPSYLYIVSGGPPRLRGRGEFQLLRRAILLPVTLIPEGDDGERVTHEKQPKVLPTWKEPHSHKEGIAILVGTY